MQKRTWLMVFAATLVLALLVLPLIGCGTSGAKQTVDGFMAAAKDKDCEKMVGYMDLSPAAAQGVSINKDELVQACKDENGLGEVVSYKVLEEKVDGDNAEIKVEVVTKENGEEKTTTDTLKVINKDGSWLISIL